MLQNAESYKWGGKNIHLCPLCTIVSTLSSIFYLVLKQTKPPNIKYLTYLLPQHQKGIWILHPPAAIPDSVLHKLQNIANFTGVSYNIQCLCLFLNKHRKLQSLTDGKQDGCSPKTFIALKKKVDTYMLQPDNCKAKGREEAGEQRFFSKGRF